MDCKCARAPIALWHLGILSVIIEEDLYDHEFVDKWCYGFDELVERVRGLSERTRSQKYAGSTRRISSMRRACSPHAKPGRHPVGPGDRHADRGHGGVRSRSPTSLPSAGNLDVPGGNVLVRYAYNSLEESAAAAWSSSPRGDARPPHRHRSVARSTRPATRRYIPPDLLLEAIETGVPYRPQLIWVAGHESRSRTWPATRHACTAHGRTCPTPWSCDYYLTPTAVAFADLVLPSGHVRRARLLTAAWWQPLRTMTASAGALLSSA